ncbi:GyrI-like domain-containing protein [Nonomuraea soli]|uniref:Effector-binding domain-containing protein n=1 Tax=Nonomuraea soli TaxID=1032476 RepID=A0A7W0CJU6_9ACTN|nr:GyrI-like domain-containing protein [Nonomuraea soli]MBA2892470.1 effector-binding domain-containing protein [Nonomuraea soli]
MEPTIIDRPAQPYMGIKGTVTMTSFAKIADRIPELAGWLPAHGLQIVGAPFFRYYVIDMDGDLQLEVGFPVASTTEGEGDIKPGELPAGRYASVMHHGHPDGLKEVTADLLARDLAWDVRDDRWGARLEVFHTNPAEQPDWNEWDTELLFKLKD